VENLKKIAHVQFFDKIEAVALGIIVAYVSWNLSIESTIFSSLLFFAYFYINQRSYLFIFILSYYLFASRGLLIGTENYYDSSYMATLIWLSASLLTTSVWITIWSPSQKKRLLLFPIMLTLLIVPPIGFISWVNPIISSAIVFPKFGFLGIVFYLLTLYLVTILLKDKQRATQTIIIIFILFISTLIYKPIKKQKQNIIYPINSNLKYKNQAVDFLGDYRRQKKLLLLANRSKHNNLLFHENALGSFNQNSMMIWERLDNNKTILAGAYIYKEVGGYDNVLIELNNRSSKIIYRQRVPVPISMWQPWIE